MKRTDASHPRAATTGDWVPARWQLFKGDEGQEVLVGAVTAQGHTQDGRTIFVDAVGNAYVSKEVLPEGKKAKR